MSFTQRLTAPEKGNKFYNTKSVGGYSSCIIGNANPRNGSNRKGYDGLNVLPNCVGYVLGRFNEISGSWKYSIGGNAEDFFANAAKLGLRLGQKPKVGAIICWRKGQVNKGSDGCGHVAIVEKVISDTEIVCSQSGWSYTGGAMWIATHKKGKGNWIEGGDYNWMKNGYEFQGFIYNPDAECGEVIRDLNVICYNIEFTVKAITKDGTNYIRLRDLEEVLHLCGIGWFNNTLLFNGRPLSTSNLSLINQDNTNYIRLRDLDEQLHICKVTYDTLKKKPILKIE